MVLPTEGKNSFANVKHVVLVLSGKGGVGKSTVTVQLAAGLQLAGKRVGVLDTDLCGPSIPAMLGVDTQAVHQCSEGWVPVYTDASQTLGVMSIGFLLKDKKEAVVWRGPKKTALIKQFLEDVCWGLLDYLIIDTPPGTSDEHLAIAESIMQHNPDGAVLVTTPQNVALADVAREANFCKKINLPIIGLVENMSGFVCPNCAECSNLFSSGGGERLAQQYGIPYLGHIPIDPLLGQSAEQGKSFLRQYPHSGTKQAIDKILGPILAKDQ